PRPAAQPLGAHGHGGHVPHGRPPGGRRGVRPPGGPEPGDLRERRRVAGHDRVAARAPARGAVPGRALRHRARARRARADVRGGGAVRRVACRHSRRRHVPFLVLPLARLPRVPAAATEDPRPPRRDDRREPAGGGRERALFPGRLGGHPERRGHELLQAERPPPERCADRAAAAPVPGRIEPRNGLGTLLDAMPHILARHPGALLTVAGDGPWRGYYERRARELGTSVRFVGKVFEDRPDYYGSADLYLCPTQIASFGVTLLEALAGGTPEVG